MQRRHFLAHSSLLIASAGLGSKAMAQSSEKVQNLSQVLAWLDQLDAAPGVKTTGAWPLSAILEHLSQSIEMSMDSFTQHKSALFQSTLGAAAFGYFKWRGQMSHSLSEPIPGAPALSPLPAWKPSAQRLRAAISRFNGHTAALKPHFAYGHLSKADYIIAHTLHIANHQDEISLHRLA
jgi:Protein of unknown function (DUF1569)